MGSIRFELNGQAIEVTGSSPNKTLLEHLRGPLELCGTKEGCAEGDCGACTVVVVDPEAQGGPAFRAINSCLVLLPLIDGKRVFSVEGLAQGGEHHLVQEALVERFGSQCGYCTPGVIMSLFEAAYRSDLDSPWKLDDQMCGNLCRCTGYRPIREAAEAVAGACPAGRFAEALEAPHEARSEDLIYEAGGERFYSPRRWESLWPIIEAEPEARFVLGATDLGLDVTQKGTRFTRLVNLAELPGMRGITETEAGWRIGAGTSLSELEARFDEELPPLARMLRFFGSRQIKNRGTLGGNLCNASPIGDTPPVLLALGATLIARSADGERRIPIDEFFLGYRKTALRPGEVLAAIDLPRLPEGARASSYKVSKRREMDISAVAACFLVTLGEGELIREARLAYGGMAATPSRAPKAEAALRGARFEAASFEAAAAALEEDFQPLSDHRGSDWYRRTVARNLLIGFFDEVQVSAVPRLADRPTHTLHSATPQEV